jgi:SAM-dependent methyltransferase
MSQDEDKQITAYVSAYKNRRANEPSWITAATERRTLVEQALQKLELPVRVLDIGCGTGATTSWIGEEEGNYWIGVDTIDQATLGVQVPCHGEFVQGSFNDELIRNHANLRLPFDLAVDHGAIATSLQRADELADYLSRVGGRMRVGGIFAVLATCTPEGAPYNGTLPDGRARRFFAPRDFGQPPFSGLFRLDDTTVITYAPNSPSNPYSKVPGNDRPISIAHAILVKK